MKKVKNTAAKALFAFAFVAALFSMFFVLSNTASTKSNSNDDPEVFFDDGNGRDGIFILSPIAFI